MCTLFANKLYSTNTYFYSPVWIMMVYNNFDSQNLLLLCLQISPQIFAILQNFPINNLRDQQFCTLLCELERLVVVLFTGIALEVDVPPGMVWSQSCKNVCGVSPPELAVCLRVSVRPCCLPAAAAWPPARCGWGVEWCLVTMLVSAAGSSFTYATFNQQPLMADEIKEQSINVWRLWQLCDNA